MSDQKLKIAVFIDFDNVEIGVKTTLGLAFDIGAVLEAIKERGEIVTKVAFGDWKRSGDYGRAMSNHAVRLVQRVMTPGGDKNGADINLALDALEMAFTHSHINAFVIVGGDSDFITLVEKLKQYDRKVFVVGGRAFTSQVMQKNCTEFIAYENIVPAADRRGSQPRHERGGERPRAAGGRQPIDQAVPLVKRALKVLADREVSPQLGLLKSTLLQLDSSFSERDYGSGSFRDFADKLAEQGVVVLKHQGRSTLVELNEGQRVEPVDAGNPEGLPPQAPMQAEPHEPREPREPRESRGRREPREPQERPEMFAQQPRSIDEDQLAAAREAGRRAARELRESGGLHDGHHAPDAPDAHDAHDAPDAPDAPETREAPESVSLGEGVALVRRALAEAVTQPRWPMYPRQFKQFLRSVQADFDERRYGSIAELMRACQKDGILRLERDRQGGLRVFANTSTSSRASVPHGWGLVVNQAAVMEDTGEGPAALEDVAAASVIEAEATVIEVEPGNAIEPGNEAEPRSGGKAKAKRARKAPAKPAAAKKTAAKRVTRKKAD